MAVTDLHGTITLSPTSRTVADMVTNGTTTITSATAAFVSGDVGRLVSGSADLPAGAYIASVTNGTTAVLSVAATGSHSAQSLTLGTEFVVAESTAAGVYIASFDLSNFAAGDAVENRLYEMILTGGVRRVIYADASYGAPLTDAAGMVMLSASTALADTGAIRFTLKQTKGTGRAVDWNFKKHA